MEGTNGYDLQRWRATRLRRRITSLTLLPVAALGSLVACGEALAGPGGPVSKAVYNVPASITADCSVDVTAALEAWFATVPDSSTLVFGKNACYNVDGGLVVADRHDLTFDGNGSTFKLITRGTANRANWIFRAGSDITLRNMIARGANPNAGLALAAYDTKVEWQHAYRFQGTQTATLDSVQAYDMYGDFVEAEPDWRVPFPGPPVRNLTVRNSHFERNGRMGIGLTHIDGFLLTNSYLGDVRWSAIDLELDDSREIGKNIRIQNNHFGPIYHSMFANQGAGVTGSIQNVSIVGNIMDSGPRTCVPAITIQTPAADRFWSDYVIDGNTLSAYGWSIGVANAQKVTIRNNTFRFVKAGGCGASTAINVRNSHTGTISGNTFVGYPQTVAQDTLTTGFSVTNSIQN